MRFASWLAWPLVAAAAAVGSLAGAGAYTVHTSGATAYLSNDPAACANCHIMRDYYDSWQKASHHPHAVCNDCHTPRAFIPKYLSKLENGYWHSKGFTLQDFHEPIRIREKNRAVLNDNCRACHKAFVSEILHADGPADRLDCIRCHTSVGHGPTR